MDNNVTITKMIGLLFAVALLGGCAPKNRPIYCWEDYQETIYQYYQQNEGNANEKQIAHLHEIIEKSRAQNLPVPPGLHAHLGLLYIKTGHPDQGFTEFNTEKSLFPESAHFVDFLMSKDKRSVK